MSVQTVRHGSPEYDLTVELRREVLRRPLGLDFTQEQLDGEADDIHLAVLTEERALACLVLTAGGAATFKMRQVAVDPRHQGAGLGRRIVEVAEWFARTRGYLRIALNARETAVPFYLALDYAIEGEPFEEVGLPHRAMVKAL